MNDNDREKFRQWMRGEGRPARRREPDRPKADPAPGKDPIVPWRLSHNDRKFLRGCKIDAESGI